MSASKSPNGFARGAQKVYNPIGFKRGYNFALCEDPCFVMESCFTNGFRAGFIFAGALFGFVLARLQYLSVDGKFRAGASPGDWYWLQHGYLKIGITHHLATILPAGFLVVFQVRPQYCANRRLCTNLNDCYCSFCQSFVTKL